MKALVIYESFFRNTEKIAQSIADTLESKCDVQISSIGDMKVEQISGVDLLIVGSPTRAFRPTKGITDFLKKIPSNGLNGKNVASFDTRISTSDVKSGALKFMVNTFGYAAKPVADKLVKKGGKLTKEPEGFFVNDSEGPLKEGEIERAAQWAVEVFNAAQQ